MYILKWTNMITKSGNGNVCLYIHWFTMVKCGIMICTVGLQLTS